MPLFKKNKKDEAPSKSTSLPIAMGVRAKNKPKPMAQGGMVEPKEKTIGELIGYPGSTPVKKAFGGEVEEHLSQTPSSLRNAPKTTVRWPATTWAQTTI